MDKYNQQLRRVGPETPGWVSSLLARYGTNPYGDPMYRLVWSERKMYYVFGEMMPQYEHFDRPQWVMEHWTSPEKDAGPPAQWASMESMFGKIIGPYPSHGFYNMIDPVLPVDWIPTEETVRNYCIALDKSMGLSDEERARVIRESLERKEQDGKDQVVSAIEEMMDSASMDKIQQAVSGPKNNFRTVDDYVRDLERSPLVKNVTLPQRGGKIMSEGL